MKLLKHFIQTNYSSRVAPFPQTFTMKLQLDCLVFKTLDEFFKTLVLPSLPHIHCLLMAVTHVGFAYALLSHLNHLRSLSFLFDMCRVDAATAA